MSPLTSYLADLGAWNWLILAGVFFSLELLAPGIFFIWFGISAAAVGALALSLDIAWQWQLVTFALLSLVSVIAAKIYLRGQATETDRPLLNKRAQQHIGRSYVLEEAIENGRGKIRVGDSLWRVEGPDRPKGERVVVTGADGTVLHVEPAEA
ncbi:MAG: NfeD family protein [Hyphomicrobiales bacterium]|nr:NfeD family protein [Hyphomicrobiales bacterium]